MHFFSRKQKVLGIIGSYLLPFFPRKTDNLKNKKFTLSDIKGYDRLDHILKLGLIHNIIKANKPEELAKYHLQYWQSDNATHYHKQAESAEAILPQFAYFIDEVNGLIRSNSVNFTTLCEIGSGSGKLLHHLSDKIKVSNHFIGLDLSQETVIECNQKYGKDNISYFAADAKQWIEDNGQAHWVYLSYRGVLEYFPQDMLLSFLKGIARRNTPCIFIIVEPIGVNHDLSKSNQSEHYSNEFSFSHHYEYLFESAGFTIHSNKIKPYIANANLVCLIASCGLSH